MVITEQSREQKTALKYFTRLNVYKGNNVSFNPETKTALSYNWWEFVKVIGGKLVFNSYHYSQSTCKHQSKVRRLLDQLGLEIDINVEAPEGLQHVQNSLDYMGRKIEGLKQKAKTGRKGSWAQNYRLESIHHFEVAIQELKQAYDVDLNERLKKLED